MDVVLEDKKNYVRSVLADKPFTKEFKILEDTTLVFRELKGVEEIQLETFLKELPEDSGLSKDELRERIIVLSHLKSFNGKPYTLLKELDKIDVNIALNQVLDFFKDKTSTFKAVLFKCWYVYDSLMNNLLDEIHNENFWKAAG